MLVWGPEVAGCECMDGTRGSYVLEMSVVVLCLDSLCRWQVQVSVYCARRIPAHLRCTQCSTLSISAS